MQMLAAVLGANGAAVTVEHGVVGHLNLVVEVYKLLHVLVFVLHVVALSNIAHDTCVETLDHELKRSDSERVTWLKVVVLLRLKHFVKAA